MNSIDQGPKLEPVIYQGVIEQPSQPAQKWESQDLLNAVPGLQHHHTVPPDHHHPDLVLRFLRRDLGQLHI